MIAPACIPKNYDELVDTLNLLSFAPEIHLDVVDGEFAAPASWPYADEQLLNNETRTPLSLRAYLGRATVEVDLMTSLPLPAAHHWAAAGADALVFHIETISPSQLAAFDEDHASVSIGVALHGDTPLESLLEYATHADYVQLMGIKTIGAHGAPFDEGVFDRIRYVQTHLPQLPISVDGSVNQSSIKALADAGVHRLVVGSAITLQPNPLDAYRSLQALINAA
jgi:ribulose-phosphate 3-epimerase